MKDEVAVLGSPSLISLMVSVDVKQHLKEIAKIRAQELCESRGGRPDDDELMLNVLRCHETY